MKIVSNHTHKTRFDWYMYLLHQLPFKISDNDDIVTCTVVCIKALANEDTLLRTHCCRHKCFPVYPREQHLLRTQILCPGQKNVSDFVQKHFVSATNVFQFAQHGNTTFILCPARLRAQETSWATMCPQQCVLVFQGLQKSHQTREQRKIHLYILL